MLYVPHTIRTPEIPMIGPSILAILSAAAMAFPAKVLDTAWTRTYGKGYGRQILVLPDSGFLLSNGKAVFRLASDGTERWRRDLPDAYLALRGAGGAAALSAGNLVLLDSLGREEGRVASGALVLAPDGAGG
jgi:hypothetical protein